MSKLLTSKEVLELLRIKDANVIGWLVQRDLLPRTVLGPRTFRYEEEDVRDLLDKVRSEGIQIMTKP